MRRDNRTTLTEKLTPEQLAKEIAELHPAIRASFVYLPDPRTATREEMDEAFPCLRTNKVKAVRLWLEARERHLAAQPALLEGDAS